MATYDTNKQLTISLDSQVQILVFEITIIKYPSLYCEDFIFKSKENVMVPWRNKISLLVLKTISLVHCTHSWNIFPILEVKFCITLQACNILCTQQISDIKINWIIQWIVICLLVGAIHPFNKTEARMLIILEMILTYFLVIFPRAAPHRDFL